MSDDISELIQALRTPYGCESAALPTLTEAADLIESQAAEIDALQESNEYLNNRCKLDRELISDLEKENFALAANQCHEGYLDPHGHHRCCYRDEIGRYRNAIKKHLGETGFNTDDYAIDLWLQWHGQGKNDG